MLILPGTTRFEFDTSGVTGYIEPLTEVSLALIEPSADYRNCRKYVLLEIRKLFEYIKDH